MSIRIGIYDFFAYTVPGGLLLLLGFAELYSWGWPDIRSFIEHLNTWQIFLLIIAAYLTGYAFEPFISKWNSLFEPRDLIAATLSAVQKRNPRSVMEIHPLEWPVWFALIRRESLDMALEIDRFMAIAKMMRGLSFFLALAAFALIANVIFGHLPAWCLVVPAVSAVLTLTSVRQAIRFKKLFFTVIFETTLSRGTPYSTDGKMP